MTSFIIDAHKDRPIPPSWEQDPECPFCRIVQGDAPAFRVYEDDMVVAVLDILPLRQGHTLVIPKVHTSRVSELSPEFAAATGKAVSKVANALTKALDNTALNVVCNQEYAQAVPHVHYHIIPAPKFGSSAETVFGSDHVTLPISHKEMHKREFEARQELDDGDATSLIQRIHARL